MQRLKCVLTVFVGLSAAACGAEMGADTTMQNADVSALTLPFPDEYFDMLMGRDAATVAEPPEGCAPLLEATAAAWAGLQETAQFKQLADTKAWQDAEALRSTYAASGCFTSGDSLDAPSTDCKPEFGKLVGAWHGVERMPQFHVFISGGANHDLYASWTAAVAAHCVFSS